MGRATPIDWRKIAEELGSLEVLAAGGTREQGGRELARAALEKVLTPERLEAAVDYYVAGAEGSELARSVLWLLHPFSAMQRCREIFASAADLRARRSAVELLRVVADRRALPWIADFLADPDPEIQNWGIGVLDQLVCSSLVEPEDIASLLELASGHERAYVRESAARIRTELEPR